MESNEVYINGQMDKERVASIHNRILFSLKKEEKFVIFDQVDEPERCYTKRNKLGTERQTV